VKVGLIGDVMLGRMVGRAIEAGSARGVVAPEVVAIARESDVLVVNLECCISARGERWPDPNKPFYFRAPPAAIEVLTRLGVDVVTLANNHALDYGGDAFIDTLELLHAAGIATVGGGSDESAARAAQVITVDGFRLAVIGVTDHPEYYAARVDRAGVAYARFATGLPAWLRDEIAAARAQADAVLVSPHWGPNMTSRPVAYVRRAARELRAAGATLVAGHSAHVFHGIEDCVFYDLGDFVDDYMRDPVLRNDLGIVVLVELAPTGATEAVVVPIALEHCHTRRADDDAAEWVLSRMRGACAELGTATRIEGRRLVVTLTAH